MREETIAIDYLQFCFYLYFAQGDALFYYTVFIVNIFLLS